MLSLPASRKKGSVRAVAGYIRLKLLTGLRRGDLLRLTVSDLRGDGIHVKPHKTASTTGKVVIYEWTEELRQAVALCKSARPVDISPWLFCNRRGEGYLAGRPGGCANTKPRK